MITICCRHDLNTAQRLLPHHFGSWRFSWLGEAWNRRQSGGNANACFFWRSSDYLYRISDASIIVTDYMEGSLLLYLALCRQVVRIYQYEQFQSISDPKTQIIIAMAAICALQLSISWREVSKRQSPIAGSR